MLLSLALIMILGMAMGWLCRRCNIPGLFGMLITGILLGPHVLGLVDGSILGISTELRRIALIIILIRAGLSLQLGDLRRVGRPAVLMCFLPACCEMVGMVLLAPMLLGVTRLEAAVLGAVVAAVSPAVIVPHMISLMEEGYGTEQSIPQMILAGASVDDVFVIVMFSTFTGLAQGGEVSVRSFVNIPISIVVGAVAGLGIGWLLSLYFTRVHMRDTVKVIILFAAAFLLVSAEDAWGKVIPFASLIAVMAMGIGIHRWRGVAAERLTAKFGKLWVFAEIMLFVLVGATVDIGYARSAGPAAVVLLFGVLVFRMAGVFLCLLGTALNRKERLFCMMAYTPKATVQAAIGGLPLSMGLACGNIVLAVSVLAILITAPLGAFMIDYSYRKLLRKAAEKG